MDQLKFIALDTDDLSVVSAHLQDAVLKVSDVLWRPQEKRLVLALHRLFDGAMLGKVADVRAAIRAGAVVQMS